MTRTIKLSKRAAKKIDKLLEYLENEWSLNVKQEFIDKLDKSLQLILENPDLFPESTLKRGLHKCVLTKQTTIFYRVDKKGINIVTLFDNRQDPKKLNKETK